MDSEFYPQINDDDYKLISTHYKADNFTNGRAFKKFFDEFCRKIFAVNSAMFKDTTMQSFPIAYSEKNSYASIAYALHSITPYVLGEWSVEYQPSENKSKQNRFVDFWCMDDKKNFEAWIEIKKIELNISNSVDKWDFAQWARIQTAIKQIENLIREVKVDKEKTAKNANLKIVLLNIPIHCKVSQIPDDKIIESAPYKVVELLANVDYKVKWRKKGVLCGVLNLDPQFKKLKAIQQGKEVADIYIDNRYTPYFALGAIVLE